MPKRTSYDLRPAWQQMQQRGCSRLEVVKMVVGTSNYGLKKSICALFEKNGLLTWTDEDGKLHAYKEVEYVEELD